jgi:hypothetical protein
MEQDECDILLKNISLEPKTVVIKDISHNRYLLIDTSPTKKTSVTNFLDKQLCDKIIDECELFSYENNGSTDGHAYFWTKENENGHLEHPTTDLNIRDVTSLTDIFYELCCRIFDKIKVIYSMSNNIVFKVFNSFVVKYEYNKKNDLEMHTDGGDITANILLSDPLDFEGGGTLFEDDGSIYKSGKGGLIIHNSNSTHSGLKITKGKRYVLVIFIEVYDLISRPL